MVDTAIKIYVYHDKLMYRHFHILGRKGYLKILSLINAWSKFE